jgi:hypothetical protein
VSQSRNNRHLERLLREARFEPPSELVQSLTPRRAQRRQFAFAGALTAALLVGLASVGGVSYAANAVNHAVRTAKKVVVPAKHHRAKAPTSVSAGGDQYRPGYGFGDPNHNHTGPPGLSGNGGGKGEKAPPGQTRPAGKGILVISSFSSDEQAAVYFSVLDPSGTQLLLTQKGTTVGGNATTGVQTKTIHYVLLVPRVLGLQIRVPANLLEAGKTYNLRIIAVDHEGNKSTQLIPFTA